MRAPDRFRRPHAEHGALTRCSDAISAKSPVHERSRVDDNPPLTKSRDAHPSDIGLTAMNARVPWPPCRQGDTVATGVPDDTSSTSRAGDLHVSMEAGLYRVSPGDGNQVARDLM